jgi:hypothetical protein
MKDRSISSLNLRHLGRMSRRYVFILIKKRFPALRVDRIPKLYQTSTLYLVATSSINR